MGKNRLIDALDSAIMECDDREQLSELIEMRVKEKERILLEERGWDATKKIYLTGNGYYKTKAPIQICRAKRNDVVEKMYEYFYGDVQKTSTLDECFIYAMAELENDVKWKQRKSTSKKIYESNWDRFFKRYPISKRPINKITNSDILNHLKVIVAELNLTRSGLKDAKTILNRAFDWAVNNDVIQTNIARNISTRSIVCRKANRSILVYTDEEREVLLRVMASDDHIASRALSLMFCLCIRSGEVRALKWSDVDWGNRTIYIHSQISRSHDENGHNIYIDEGETKNHDEAGNRFQKLSDRAYEILKLQRKLSPFSTYIFEYNNHVLEPNMLNRRLKKMCALANINYMPTHKIRFWSVTKMCASGISPVEMQYTAGHKCKQTTDYYVRVGRQTTLQADKVQEMYG